MSKKKITNYSIPLAMSKLFPIQETPMKWEAFMVVLARRSKVHLACMHSPCLKLLGNKSKMSGYLHHIWWPQYALFEKRWLDASLDSLSLLSCTITAWGHLITHILIPEPCHYCKLVSIILFLDTMHVN